jgi:chromosome segregation ATPase
MRDVTAGIAGLTAEMREANARREHIGQDVKRIEDNQRDLGKRVSSIEKNQESFRPYIEIMKQINTRMWIILMGVMGVAAMAAYKIV